MTLSLKAVAVYRELGFATHDEWYLALDNEDYLLRLKQKAKPATKCGNIERSCQTFSN